MTPALLLAAVALADAPEPPRSPTAAAWSPAPLIAVEVGEVPDALDLVAYERNMQIARAGLYAGIGGAGLVLAGGIGILYGYEIQSPELALGSFAVLGVGAAGLLAGPVMTTAGAMYAAARLEDGGIRVDKGAGWVGVGLLIAGVAIGTWPLAYVGSGIQMGVNQRALGASGREVAWFVSGDARDRTLQLHVVF